MCRRRQPLPAFRKRMCDIGTMRWTERLPTMKIDATADRQLPIADRLPTGQTSTSHGDTMNTQTDVDVADEMSRAPLGRLHKWLGVMLAALTLFDGYDTFNPA